MSDKRLTYRLRFSSNVSIFTGLGVAGLVDRTVVRSADGIPEIPGSTVKGRLRFFARALLTSASLPPLSLHPANSPTCRAPGPICTDCRLFGSPLIAGLMKVGAARPTPACLARIRNLRAGMVHPIVHSDAEVRPGIAVSRRRRAPLVDHLFFDETVPTTEFEGALILNDATPDEIRFLKLAGSLVDALGSRKAAGRGRLAAGVEIG